MRRAATLIGLVVTSCVAVVLYMGTADEPRATPTEMANAVALAATSTAQATEVKYEFDGTDAEGFRIVGTMKVRVIPGGMSWFGSTGPQGSGCVGNDVGEGFECGKDYTSDMHLPPVTNCTGGTRIDWGSWRPTDDSHRYNIASTTAVTSFAEVGSIAIHKTNPDGTRGPMVACAVPVVSR